ncbi:NAD(P)-dependent oxidoreductase [Paramicrobacterium chengjingii]|uniref:NAD(P)-dependent oxidoreductase n=1 Tax=Paramicrobacterium chengjingii TaxID=2769067 RepID=UPI00142116BB|nr:NAD(P)-dependent oxidoreductase [Microbacterium chengjingii]
MLASPATTIAVGENSFAVIDGLAREYEERAVLRVGEIITPEQVARLTRGASALIVTLHPLRREHIAALDDSVKIIARAGVGLDTIDVDAARERGIRVVYQPTYATNEVADQAAALALAAWRRLAGADALVRSAGWGSAAQVGAVHALQDATLGVLGTGRIGRALIRRLTPFVKSVVAFDAYRDEQLEGVEWADNPTQLFERSDLLSLHLPLTRETRHILDAEALAAMPTGAVVVNVSRGGLVDEDALADALKSGHIGAAGLDVFETEPLDAGAKLRAAPNLLLSPHVAWYSIESGDRLARWSIDDAVSYTTASTIENGAWAWA